MSEQKSLNVVWAFDPYLEEHEIWKSTANFLKMWQGISKVKIFPVYVLGHELIHWVANITPSQLKLVQPVVEEVMESRLKQLEVVKVEKPEILLSKGLSRREDVNVLANYLDQKQPNLVILNTHQRKGLKRFFMGSFAENLLLKSSLPMLMFPPTFTFGDFNHVLVPTRFLPDEKNFFEELLVENFKFIKKITLYSRIFHPIDAFAQSASYALGGGWISLEAYTQEEVGRRHRQAEEWVRQARHKGYECELIIEDGPGDLWESIHDVVQRSDVNFITMLTSATAAEATLLGSHAREIIRHSSIPVMVKNTLKKK